MTTPMINPLTIPISWTPLAQSLGLTLARQTPLSSGFDLSACIEAPVEIAPGARCLIPCGFSMVLPQGREAQIRPRSGLALKQGITVLNSPGTIDADYRGEVMALLINLGTEVVTITPGLRCAQMVVAAVDHTLQLAVTLETPMEGRLSEPPSETCGGDQSSAAPQQPNRGTGGFGSTGA